MSEATTPANQADQIAATTATRGDIASHEGDATIPAVVQDAQQYDWRSVVDAARNLILGGLVDDLAAHITRLEAERDALLAEHEAWTKWREGEQSTSRNDWNRLTDAHDNADRVIHGE